VNSPAYSSSHRERKKAKTRAALIEASQHLFAEQGYTETTLEQISAAADVRAQTLLRYFASKAELALAPLADPLSLLHDVLSDPQRSRNALDIWREYVTVEAAEVSSPSSKTNVDYVHNLVEFRRWSDKDPALVAMFSDIDRRLRDSLSSALAADRDATASDLHSTLVAALLVAGRLAVYERWLDASPDAESLLDDQQAVIDYALRSLPRRSARRLLAVGSA
jgi:AcrR family transcriptional regulator